VPSDDSKENGNQNLFDESLPLIPNAVRNACRKYKYKANQLEIDGLVQRISIKLFLNDYAALRSLKDRNSLGPWLQKIADNLVKRYVQQQRRNVSVDGLPPDVFAIEATQEEQIISEEQKEARKKELEAALSKLTSRQRTLYELSCQDDLDDAQIAELMGIKLKSVQELRHRLKRKLQKLIGEGNADLPGRKK